MTIKTRIKKLEQQHKPDETITVVIYTTDETGQLFDYHTGQPILPGQGVRVLIPGNGR